MQETIIFKDNQLVKDKVKLCRKEIIKNKEIKNWYLYDIIKYEYVNQVDESTNAPISLIKCTYEEIDKQTLINQIQEKYQNETKLLIDSINIKVDMVGSIKNNIKNLEINYEQQTKSHPELLVSTNKQISFKKRILKNTIEKIYNNVYQIEFKNVTCINELRSKGLITATEWNELFKQVYEHSVNDKKEIEEKVGVETIL